MNTLTLKAQLKNGHKYTWTFTECKNENDYGNGIYIGVDRGDDRFSIDARYITDYNFEQICTNYIKDWYGDNLKGYKAISINGEYEEADKHNLDKMFTEIVLNDFVNALLKHYPHTQSTQNTIFKEYEKILQKLDTKE